MVRVASDTLNSRVPDGPLQQKWDKHRFDMKLVNPANKRKFTRHCGRHGSRGRSGCRIVG
jgi:succinate dehydrogenase / fumarate reductase flavoprotein subunit